MTRTGIVLILMCAFLGVMFYLAVWTGRMSAEFEQLAEKELTLNKRERQIVYPVTYIQPGEIIEKSQLEEKNIDLSKIPVGALTSATEAVGKKAKTEIAEGQIILHDHFCRFILCAARDVRQGEIITSECLLNKEIELNSIPQNAIEDRRLVVGRIAPYGLVSGQIVTAKDLELPTKE